MAVIEVREMVPCAGPQTKGHPIAPHQLELQWRIRRLKQEGYRSQISMNVRDHKNLSSLPTWIFIDLYNNKVPDMWEQGCSVPVQTVMQVANKAERTKEGVWCNMRVDDDSNRDGTEAKSKVERRPTGRQAL